MISVVALWLGLAVAARGQEPAPEPAEPAEDTTEAPTEPEEVVGGVVGGLPDLDGARLMHHSELVVRKQIPPRFPKEHRKGEPGLVARCKVRVWIAEDGVPYKAESTGCPDAFGAAAEGAVLVWRWEPPRLSDGTALRAMTVIAMRFER